VIGNTAQELMITIKACINQEKTYYTRASRHKFKELLARIHHKSVGIRWISKSLKTLEDAGYIRRRCRYVHFENGNILQRPSLFWFTYKGALYLRRTLVEGARELLATMRNRPGANNEPPRQKEHHQLDEYRKLYPGEMARQKRTREI